MWRQTLVLPQVPRRAITPRTARTTALAAMTLSASIPCRFRCALTTLAGVTKQEQSGSRVTA